MLHEHSSTEYKGYTIKLIYDPDAECPLEYDEDTTIWAVWERNSIFSSRKYRPFDKPDEAITYAEANGFDIFPLFKYEHGEVAYNVSGFSCPWDSGHVGYILVKRENVEDTKKSAEITAEVMTKWCNGEFVGYVIGDDDDDHIDSCWGFDDDEYALQEAKHVVDYLVDEKAKLPGKYQAAADAALNS